MVDACTNFIDAIPCKDRTLLSVKRCLAGFFGFFGMPKVVVSDNAPEFIALKELGIRLVNTPLYNPASNGQAERSVKTIKNAIKSYISKLGDKYVYLQKVLLNHNASGEKYIRQKNY